MEKPRQILDLIPAHGRAIESTLKSDYGELEAA